MITHAQMYWIVMLDSIIGLIAAIVALSFVGIIVSVLYIAETEADNATWAPVSCAVVMLLALVVAAFVPSTKQLAAIIVVPKLANSEKVQMAGNKLYDLAGEWMDELSPAKPESAKEEAK